MGRAVGRLDGYRQMRIAGKIWNGGPLPAVGAPGYRFFRVVQDERCYLCGQIIVDAYDRSIDHIVPHNHGGSRRLPNAALAHKKCNSKKGSRKPRACELLFGVTLALIANAPVDEHLRYRDNLTPKPGRRQIRKRAWIDYQIKNYRAVREPYLIGCEKD